MREEKEEKEEEDTILTLKKGIHKPW